jgi:hypothetical protein
VQLLGVNTSFNSILGNLIGLDATGAAPLGNGREGVSLETGAGTNTLGGTAAGAANRIAFNGREGVLVFGSTLYGALANFVRGNQVFSNAYLGLNLRLNTETNINFVTPNDAGDADAGPNNLQNFPLLTNATVAGDSVTIQGSLNSVANTTFQLDFYANAACDPSGHGEGQFYLGAGAATTDAGGNAAFSVTPPVAVAAGWLLTATATDPAGNTSEFSPCLALGGSGATVVLAVTHLGGDTLALSWPSSASGYRVQVTPTLAPPIPWTNVSIVPVDDGTKKTLLLTNDLSGTNQFYRLISP